ncbi:hypothetical protein [Haloactinomyces albus]|uniref:Uncharacterized protein n=1 Tax=Haloactinomyces albus TaxID=1352928 RepID=A0AAE4CJH9_9ACTN|nr:hypothetical protein [Haloactinomyces albus]MDR7300025.1 hypothetical protein [Haloactinomyces albus]
MGLTGSLLRFGAGRPHVLLACVPGGTAERLAVEAELRRRGWPDAVSPADADILVLTGPIGARLTPMVDRLWRQVPKPRVFVHGLGAVAASEVLDDARRRLAEGGDTGEVIGSEEQDSNVPGDDHRSGEPDDEGGHGDEGGHDHGHGMEMPGGLSMAGRGPDRDGLQLDRLHVPLGPLLPDWPAGLRVQLTLQGDVVQEAQVDVLRGNGVDEDFWNEPWRRAAAGQEATRGEGIRRCVAAYLDGLAKLLRVAGWSDPAVGAGRLRDEVLAGARADQVTPRLRLLARRLRRARTLRWLTDGLGSLSAGRAEEAGVTGPVLRASHSGGDVTARWQAWLAEIERTLPAIDDPAALPAEEALVQGSFDEDPRSASVLAVLPELLEGVELAAARLIVASLDPDVTALEDRVVTEVSGD